MRNVSDEICRENHNPRFMVSNIVFFFRKSCRLLGNVEKYRRAWQATGDNITRRMRFAYWINKPTDTHSEYVISLANPRQQWLRERASVLCLYANRSGCKTRFSAQLEELSKPHSDPQIACEFQNSFQF